MIEDDEKKGFSVCMFDVYKHRRDSGFIVGM